jgi:hypothetical protein
MVRQNRSIMVRQHLYHSTLVRLMTFTNIEIQRISTDTLMPGFHPLTVAYSDSWHIQ